MASGTTRLSTAPYRGTRDFLPDEMSVRGQVYGRLFAVIESFGYVRYDGPTLEPVEIYEAKSGQELVNEQLYRLTDRGGRTLALRPEMTPTVARMVAGHAARIALPARWYSFAHFHRYERPQRGRVREHWQINVDIFGAESPEAEVEIFALIHRMFAALGAAPADYVLRASDRALVQAALVRYAGIGHEATREVFRVLDRWEKYPLAENQALLAAAGLTADQIARVGEVVGMDFARFRDLVTDAELDASNLGRILRDGLLDGPLAFDPLIVRGFEYYTSTVFEVFDSAPENRRSLFGGGRYDNLAGLFSDRRIPGIGFGMGDVTLFDFLGTHGLLPEARTAPDVALLPLEAASRTELLTLAAELRAAGLRVVTPLASRGVGKDLKDAARQGARYAVLLLPDELARGAVIVRDLARGEQREVPRERVVEVVRAEATLS